MKMHVSNNPKRLYVGSAGLTGFKGIVHFEIKIWYLSAYPKGIQDVGVFFSSVDPIFDVFRSNRSSLSVI